MRLPLQSNLSFILVSLRQPPDSIASLTISTLSTYSDNRLDLFLIVNTLTMHLQASTLLFIGFITMVPFGDGHPIAADSNHDTGLAERAPKVFKHCMGDGCLEHFVKFTPRRLNLEAAIVALVPLLTKSTSADLTRRARSGSSRSGSETSASTPGGSRHTQFPSGSGREHFPATHRTQSLTQKPTTWTSETVTFSNARAHGGSTPVASIESFHNVNGGRGTGGPDLHHTVNAASSVASHHQGHHGPGSPTHSTESTARSHHPGQKAKATAGKGNGAASASSHIGGSEKEVSSIASNTGVRHRISSSG